MTDEFIAGVLDGGEAADSVKFGGQNGAEEYREVLREASRRLVAYSGALRELLEQDVCIQHGYSVESSYCRDCGGRPEEFGGAGTCPWEIAKAALNATGNRDFETRKSMDLLCREIEHLRKRIKFLESCNARLTRKWEEQLAESCSSCARLHEKPRACDTMKAEDLIETVKKGIVSSLSSVIKDGIFPRAVEPFIDLVVSTAIKSAYDTHLVTIEKKDKE